MFILLPDFAGYSAQFSQTNIAGFNGFFYYILSNFFKKFISLNFYSFYYFIFFLNLLIYALVYHKLTLFRSADHTPIEKKDNNLWISIDFIILSIFSLTVLSLNLIVQIRDALGISLFMLGAVFLLNRKYLLTIFFFTISFFTHQLCFLTSIFLLAPPYLLVRRIASTKRKIFSYLFFSFVSILAIHSLCKVMTNNLVFEGLASQINFYRCFFIFLAPSLFIIFGLYKEKITLNDNLLNNVYVYISIFLLLSGIYLFFYESYYAERFVRISILCSILSFYYYQITKGKYIKYLAIYYLFCNSLFIAHTLYHHFISL